MLKIRGMSTVGDFLPSMYLNDLTLVWVDGLPTGGALPNFAKLIRE